MKPERIVLAGVLCSTLLGLISCATSKDNAASSSTSAGIRKAQVPSWSDKDLEFFLHGSMSTEVVPEAVLRAFIRTYPDLFPTQDLRHLGLIPDPTFGWPIGFSRGKVPHLGGLPSLGLNCAACHVTEVTAGAGSAPVRVLGATSHFDAEAYFGAVIVASFQTADPANMKKFLAAYLAVVEPLGGEKAQARFEREWQKQEQAITAALAAGVATNLALPPGTLLTISPAELQFDSQRLEAKLDLAALSRSMLRLLHNMRAALHVPDQPPQEAPPASGPGRNDAFGLLSLVLFGEAQPYAPVKYGLVWNLENRPYVHWDGNTRSPLGRNLLASLGLGAPLIGQRGQLDLAVVQRQTDLTERIHPPRYPFAIDEAAARRGAPHYEKHCATCHDSAEGDGRLYDVALVGTESRRAAAFTQPQADRLNKFLSDLKTDGYEPSREPGIRSTGKYWAASMAGVWARSPYLHNGSVRTMEELLTPSSRAKTFKRGSRIYDQATMGYADDGSYLLDTSKPGNSNTGHTYGADLSMMQKRELMEYLKTL